MGLRSIFRHEGGLPSPTTRQRLNRDAISALFWVILTALLGIILLSGLGLILRFGLFGASEMSNGQSFADEALSILGNIGSAAIGGLVGWLTRDQLDAKDTGYQNMPPMPTEEEVQMPLRIEDTSTYSSGAPVTITEYVQETDTNLEPQADVSKESEKPDMSDMTGEEVLTEFGVDPNAPDHPDELDSEEDPDLVWPDEPLDDDEEDDQ